MTKEMELLGKLELSEENRAKLLALLEEGKQSGKVSSKKLVETLDAVDATEEQTEQFYQNPNAACDAGYRTGRVVPCRQSTNPLHGGLY